MQPSLIAPNIFAGRPLDEALFAAFRLYLESQAAVGRRPGLISPDGKKPALPYLSPPDVLRLNSIYGVGELGYTLAAGRHEESEIAPLDTSKLDKGPHDVFACLARCSEPFGEVLEVPGPEGDPMPLRGHASLRSVVCLEVGEDRLRHQDWLKVAVVHREPSSGGLRTVLDQRFHPPVADLAAYARANPLERLAAEALQRLDTPEPSGNFQTETLRSELLILRALACSGDPVLACSQAMRCVAWIRASEEPVLRLDGRLEGYRLDSAGVCGFLADLDTALEQDQGEPLPELLKIDGRSFTRMDEVLEEDREFWRFAPKDNSSYANQLAVYLPSVRPGMIPTINYSPHRNEGNFFVADAAEKVSGSGSAFVLNELPHPLSTLYLTVSTEMLRQRLSLYLGDLHAIYCC